MDRADVDYQPYDSIEDAEIAAATMAQLLGHQITDWMRGATPKSIAACKLCRQLLVVYSNVITLQGYVIEGDALKKLCSGGSGLAS
jgi:hypothetical protein